MRNIIQKNLIYIIAAAIILVVGLIYFFSYDKSFMPGAKEEFDEQKLIESVTAPNESAEAPAKTLKDLTAPKPYKNSTQDIIDSLPARTKSN